MINTDTQTQTNSTSLWQRVVHALTASKAHQTVEELGDFTTTPRMVLIALIAVVIGILSAFVALVLLKLIGIFTNLFFFGRWGTTIVSPAGNHLGIFEILVPVIGALIIGFMARYGSERIRGHGIPEALEAILINGSKVQPKVAVLKPLSAAISIGSGGPFGAEGPIIVTGGAFGSMIAQFFHLSSSERKILLVSGAAAGMSATFASPIAAIMLAVEIMLFEWKPRSLIPVALASGTAAIIRHYIIGPGPIFPMTSHTSFIGFDGVLACILVGFIAGILSMVMSSAVYGVEDAFRKLPIHWMWWPAIGGLVVGIGGLIFPRALSVGYDSIGMMLSGDKNVTLYFLLGFLLVKSTIWAISLGSGTSGGILAPLLLIGGAMGGLEAYFLPNEGAGFWPLISMAAVLGGTMRAPLTGIIFAFELTYDINALPALLIAVVVAHCFSVLTMKRSILTEKVSRRGYHLSHEYAVDPLEILFVREVMRTNIAVLSSKVSPKDLAQSLSSRTDQSQRSQLQHLYPVINEQQEIIGVVTRNDLQKLIQDQQNHSGDYELASLVKADPIVAYPDEPLRQVVYRMADTGFTRFPVVERSNPKKLVGMVSLYDLLKARSHNLAEERNRERVIRMRMLFPIRRRTQKPVISESETPSQEELIS